MRDQDGHPNFVQGDDNNSSLLRDLLVYRRIGFRGGKPRAKRSAFVILFVGGSGEEGEIGRAHV